MTTHHLAQAARAPRRHHRGMTVVELMVGVTIGMVLVAAMSVLFANNSRSRMETERAGIKLDNGRYALDSLGTDLQHAGFFAEFDPRKLALPATKPGACETDIPTLRAALRLPVLGYDDVSAATLATPALNCLSDVVPGTDIVVVRRAATCINGSADCTPLVAGMAAFQASSCSDTTELGGINVDNHYRLANFSGGAATFNLHKRKSLGAASCTVAADTRRYVVNIYYIAQNDKINDGVGDGIPSLKRRELGAGAWNAPVTIAQGVQDLQVEWGLDTDGDGDPDVYATDPDKYCATATPAVAAGSCWNLAVASKLFVLARNLERSADHKDTKTYVLGKGGHATTGLSTDTDRSAGPFNDAIKRNVFHRTVALQNVVSRSFTP